MIKSLKKVVSVTLVLSMLPCICAAAEYPFEEMEVSTVPRLERLISRCGELGLETAYEAVTLQTLKDFIGYGKEIYKIDKNKGDNIFRAMQSMAINAENNLNDYLAGKEPPKENVEFVGGEVKRKGHSFLANTNKGERNVFFAGYNNAINDIDKLDKYGINLIQTEMGPYSYIMAPSEAKWQYEGVWSSECNFEINTSDFFEGKSGLKIKNLSGGNMLLYQDVSLPAGTYSLKFYAKGENVSGGGVHIITKEKEYVRNFGNLGTGWKALSYNFKISSAEKVRIAIDASASADILLLDNMTLTKSGVDYLKQGTFEYDFCYGISADDKNRGIGYDYAVSEKRYLEEIEPVFDEAEEKNIKVDFIISPHYFPKFLKDKGLEVKWNTSYNSFLTYDIYSENAKAAIEEYLKFIIPKISEKKSLFSICLSNEPKYQIAYIDGFLENHSEIEEEWVSYLSERYADISELNEAYQKNYADFSEVELSLDQSAVQKYDTVIFNSKLLSRWHSWLADIVRKYAPEIPVHTKQMKSISDLHGMNPERAAQDGYADLGGNDAYNLYYTGTDYSSDKMFWYDFVGSFADVPVFDSENHTISDTGSGATPYRKETARYVGSDLWQGAIHGRSASVFWAWEKSLDKNNIFYDSLGTRPDAIEEISKTLKDLNRLSEIVSAIQNEKPNIAILYSEASAIYESAYNGNINSLYKVLNQSGQRVSFISENQIAQGIPYKMIVVPKGTYYTNEDTLSKLNNFAAAGGRLISYSGNFKYNTKKQAQKVVLTDKADIVSGSIEETYLSAISEMELDKVVLFEGSKRAGGVDWKSANINEKTYVNICNNTFSEKTVTLAAEGFSGKYAVDLISGKSVTPSGFLLKPYTPVLLALGEETGEFVSGFAAFPEQESVCFVWDNISDFSEKYLTVFDDNNNVVFNGGMTGSKEKLSVSGLNPGKCYKAELSDGEHKEEISFRTKRSKNTSSLVKGWTLEYRGNDPYIFDEGNFAVVSNEAHSGNSSLRLTMYNSRQSMLYYQLWRDIYLKSGTTYRYTVWYKLENYGMECNAKPKFSFYANDRSNGKEVVIRNDDGTWNFENGKWYSASFDFTPTATKNYRFSLLADSGGTIWLDDISVFALKDGEATGENLLKETSSKIGGGFEAQTFCTVPEPPQNVKSEYLGGNELRIGWDNSDDYARVNIYREENGENILVASTDKNYISVYSKPRESWNYFLTASDENENESETVSVSGENMGNVSKPQFMLNGKKAENLKPGKLEAEVYAYENADLYLVLYDNSKITAIDAASGTGRLTAEFDISEENISNKMVVAYVWKNGKPLRIKSAILPEK